MEVNGLGAPSWGSRYFTLVVDTLAILFQRVMDYCIPEQKVNLPPVQLVHPAARLPNEKQEEYWEPLRHLEGIKDGAYLEDNLEALLRATECMLAKKTGFSLEFTTFLRDMALKAPNFAEVIATEAVRFEEKGDATTFYEKSTITVHQIYDSVILKRLSQSIFALALLKDHNRRFGILADEIPIEVHDERTFNRTCTKVWHLVSRMKNLDDLVKELNTEEKTYKSVQEYLRGRNPDLLKIREIALQLAKKDDLEKELSTKEKILKSVQESLIQRDAHFNRKIHEAASNLQS